MPTKKTTVKRETKTIPSSRKLKQPEYKSFKLHKSIKHSGAKLPSAWSMFKSSVKHLFEHKRVYGGIGLVYLALVIVLVRGFLFTSDIAASKDSITQLIGGFGGQIASSLTVVSFLFESSSPAGATGSLYQSIVLLLISLAAIWALRQTHAGQKITVKDAFYKSSYPLIPFLLVLIVIGLQMLPLIAGSFLYGATIVSGIAVTIIEKVLWGLLVFLLVLLSVYLVSASVFALYIVTLPDVGPMAALKSARGLVMHRRWTVIRKVLFLPFMLVLITFGILLPVIMVAAPIAEVVFLLLGAVLVMVAHSYLYTLYREML